MATRVTLADLRACADSVFQELGPGHSESTYQNAFELECQWRHLPYVRQPTLPIVYKQHVVGFHRPDLMVGHQFLIEFKVARLDARPASSWRLQLQRYLVQSPHYQGVLIVFSIDDVEVAEVYPPQPSSLPSPPLPSPPLPSPPLPSPPSLPHPHPLLPSPPPSSRPAVHASPLPLSPPLVTSLPTNGPSAPPLPPAPMPDLIHVPDNTRPMEFISFG